MADTMAHMSMDATAQLADVHESVQPIALEGRRVHLVGIGGTGMCGLAQIIAHRGAICTGSDHSDGPTLDPLRCAGIAVQVEQTAATVPRQCDLMVISAAIQPDHPEVIEAHRRGIPVFKYAQMLGRLMLGHTGIAVAGTHGKSSTTSMLAHVLIQCGLDPSVIVGAHCPQIGGGWRSGGNRGGGEQRQGGLLVAEACEYDRSFHHLHPQDAIILNVEADHLDLYRGLDEIVEAFTTFAALLPPDGLLLIQHECANRLQITGNLRCQVRTIGFAPQADWRIELKMDANGRGHTQLHRNGDRVARWACPLPGEHMAYNAAAAAVMAHRHGAAWEDIGRALETFDGLDRRMQRLGQCRVGSPDEAPITVVDDYGHHPTEVDTTLRALRRFWRPGRLICVFQPHQHSRTRFLMDQFAASFSAADIVIIPRIYFVRDSEQERQAVTAGDLVDRLRQRGVMAMHLYPFDAIVEQLQVIARPGDLLVTMGAGDVWKVAHAFLQAAKTASPLKS